MAELSRAQVSQSLSKLQLFTNLPPNVRSSIEKRCTWHRYEAGEPIVSHLDSGDDVFFIVTGEARASLYSVQGKAITFCDLKSGDMFGEYAAIDGRPRSASIEARTPCLIASMRAGVFRGLLKSEPAIAISLLEMMVAKVRSLTSRIYEVSALAVNNRIHAELLRLADTAPRTGPAATIDPSPTHIDIASRTSTHREAVTRELNRLKRIGVLEKRGRMLVVRDVQRLAAMVHEATGE